MRHVGNPYRNRFSGHIPVPLSIVFVPPRDVPSCQLDNLEVLDKLEKLEVLDKIDELEFLDFLATLGYLEFLDILDTIEPGLPLESTALLFISQPPLASP